MGPQVGLDFAPATESDPNHLEPAVDKVFIYWDNSNIFIGARQVAAEREGGDARYRVRIDFRNLLALASAGRPVEHAVAVGSIPPELRHVWNRLEGEGVTVQLFERGAIGGREQAVDHALQTAMLRDGYDHNGDPGIAVLLTGDGAGFHDGVGFQADLERMFSRGWKFEVISWRHSCNNRMRRWAERNGRFIALDDFYESVTFLEPSSPGQPLAAPRDPTEVDLAKRQALQTMLARAIRREDT